MKKIAYFLFLSLLMFLVSCSPKWDPRKYRRVEIIDAGEIYSTFDINKHEKEKKILDKKRWLPDSVLRKVTAASSESRWPPAIQTPQLRHDNQKKMKQYKAYVVTSFKNKHILYIPNAENKGANIAPELLSDRDFYMIIGKKGIEKKEEYMKGYEKWTRPPRPQKPKEAMMTSASRSTTAPQAQGKEKEKGKDAPQAQAQTKEKKKGAGVPNLDEKQPANNPTPQNSASAKDPKTKEKENPSAAKTKPEKQDEKPSVAKAKPEKEKPAKSKETTASKNAKKAKVKSDDKREDKEASFEKGKLTGKTKKRVHSETSKKKKKKKVKKKKGKKTTKPTPKKELLPTTPEKGKSEEKPKEGK